MVRRKKYKMGINKVWGEISISPFSLFSILHEINDLKIRKTVKMIDAHNLELG